MITSKIIYQGTEYTKDKIAFDMKEYMKRLDGNEDSVYLSLYENEYERAVSTLVTVRNHIATITYEEEKNPQWLYPYCNYIIKENEQTPTKLDSNVEKKPYSSLLSPILSESIYMQSYTDEDVELYIERLSEVEPLFSVVLIPVGLSNDSFLFAFLSSITMGKDIVIYHTINEINEYFAQNSNSALMYGNGQMLKQFRLFNKEVWDYLGGMVFCDLPLSHKFINLIKDNTAQVRKYFLTTKINENDRIKLTIFDDIRGMEESGERMCLSGIYVETEYIEKCISSYPLIHKNIVTIQPDENGIGRLICFYMIAQEQVDEIEIKQYLATKLPWFAIPDRFVHITEFPISVDLKVDKQQLPYIYGTVLNETEQLNELVYREAVNLLAEYIRREVEEEDLEKPIEVLGINSLLFIDYIVSLEDRIGFEMPDNMLDIALFKSMRHLISYLSKIC